MLNLLNKQKETTMTSTKMYVSTPINRVQNIENRINKIFQDELKSRGSILVSYKPEVIPKLTRFILGQVNRPASIGITGETASGKSTITLDIINTIEAYANELGIENAITRVNSDDYYYDRSEMVKEAGSFAEFAKNYDLDVPEALELELMNKHIKELLSGKSVYLPKYEMSGTAVRHDNYTLAKPSKIIISEGLYTLTEKVKDAFDFKIYVDVKSGVQKERFYTRAEERGLGKSARTIYKNASQKAKIYIKPCKEDADIVLSGEAVRGKYKVFLSKILVLAEENLRAEAIRK